MALYFGPVMDGTVLPCHPFRPDAPPQSAQSAQVPMVGGFSRDGCIRLRGRDRG